MHVVGEPGTFCGPAPAGTTPTAPSGGTAAVATAAGQPSSAPLTEADKNALIQDFGYEAPHTSMSKKTAPSASASSGGAGEVNKNIQKKKELTRRHGDGDQACRDPITVEEHVGLGTTQKSRQ